MGIKSECYCFVECDECQGRFGPQEKNGILQPPFRSSYQGHQFAHHWQESKIIEVIQRHEDWVVLSGIIRCRECHEEYKQIEELERVQTLKKVKRRKEQLQKLNERCQSWLHEPNNQSLLDFVVAEINKAKGTIE